MTEEYIYNIYLIVEDAQFKRLYCLFVFTDEQGEHGLTGFSYQQFLLFKGQMLEDLLAQIEYSINNYYILQN